jgi:protease-4
MKDFFKFMFASMLGTFLLMVLSVFISIIILVAIVASASSDETVITKNTLLHLRLDKPIVDRAPSMKFTFDLSGPGKMTGLNELLDNIRKAKHDENITGIYLDLTDIPAGISTLEEIRDALMAFKTSGKFIWAYSESYSQRAYYLASVADRVFLNPEGSLEFKGLAAELTFIKGLLDKIDVKMQIIRHGKFKAATEPLFLEKMSPENRKQITELINGIWNKMLADISESRKISKSSLSAIADSLKIETAVDALKAGFVDQLVYKDELIREMKKKMNVAESKKLSTVSDASYTSVPEKKKQGLSSEKIAVIYASGSIGSGEGDDESIGSERISKAIRKAREDEKVKAIVFRINSGGGSALASDVIWREIDLARQAKPVVASFGDVAASGGYYIACAASRIVANPTTLTGSIGVFGVVPNMEGLFSKKLGITFDRAMTNPNSDYISVVKPLTPYQEKKIQKDVDHIYDVFTGKVAEGRKISKVKVDSIGQGRIWNGIDAQKIKLLDEFGGLTRSVELAASMAGIKDYRLISLPEQKEWFEELISELTGADPSSKIREILGPDYQLYEYMKEIREMKGIQARSLYDIEIR